MRAPFCPGDLGFQRNSKSKQEIDLAEEKMMAFLKGVGNGHKNDDSQLGISFSVGPKEKDILGRFCIQVKHCNH